MNDWKADLYAIREANRLAAIRQTDRRIKAKQRKRRQRTRDRIARGWTLSTGLVMRPIA